MKLEDCNKDPKFRQAFIENEIRMFNDIISGINISIRHSNDYISMLDEMIDILELNEQELGALNEELSTLNKNILSLEKQKNTFGVIINIYNKYLYKKKENNIKLKFI